MTHAFGHPPTDAALVAATLAGDRHGFAGIYDRYADGLHDFCWALLRDDRSAADALVRVFVLAGGRLRRLGDPDGLRGWLYALARSVALSELTGRRRGARGAGAQAAPNGPVAARGPGGRPAAEAGAPRAELQELLWDAVRELPLETRVVLDLHLRQGLGPREIAQVLRCGDDEAAETVKTLCDRAEHDLTALLVARSGAGECERLAGLVRDWDGRFSPLVRERVTAHIDDCDVCRAHRTAVPSPCALLGTVPAVPAPAEVRQRALDASVVRPANVLQRVGAPKVAAAVVSAVMLLSAGLTSAQVLRTLAPEAVVLDEAGRVAVVTGGGGREADLVVRPASLVLRDGGTGSFVICNTGRTDLVWTASSPAPWLRLSAEAGRVAPGAEMTVRVSVEDGVDASGVAIALSNVTYGGQTERIPVQVTQRRAPEVAPPPNRDGDGESTGRGGRTSSKARRGADKEGSDGRGRPDHADERGRPDHAGEQGPPDHAGESGKPAQAGDRGPPDHAAGNGPPEHAGEKGPPDHAGKKGPPEHAKGKG